MRFYLPPPLPPPEDFSDAMKADLEKLQKRASASQRTAAEQVMDTWKLSGAQHIRGIYDTLPYNARMASVWHSPSIQSLKSGTLDVAPWTGCCVGFRASFAY